MKLKRINRFHSQSTYVTFSSCLTQQRYLDREKYRDLGFPECESDFEEEAITHKRHKVHHYCE